MRNLGLRPAQRWYARCAHVAKSSSCRHSLGAFEWHDIRITLAPGRTDMLSTEIAAYVLLLSLPLWLLVEQLIHLRKEPSDGQQGSRRAAEERRPDMSRAAPGRGLAFQPENDMVWPSRGAAAMGPPPRAGREGRHADHRPRRDHAGLRGAGECSPAFVFVHGWTCNRVVLRAPGRALRPRHRVVSVDLRGHGDSDKPQGAYPISAYADVMHRLPD